MQKDIPERKPATIYVTISDSDSSSMASRHSPAQTGASKQSKLQVCLPLSLRNSSKRHSGPPPRYYQERRLKPPSKRVKALPNNMAYPLAEADESGESSIRDLAAGADAGGNRKGGLGGFFRRIKVPLLCLAPSLVVLSLASVVVPVNFLPFLTCARGGDP
ncbi:hypothetical protein BDZ88DRAFT_318427 [Geranomyces variabilis]|nr:hypothetical protein BDZ88DRAFT_318427 [Geranomyces variabilis]